MYFPAFTNTYYDEGTAPGVRRPGDFRGIVNPRPAPAPAPAPPPPAPRGPAIDPAVAEQIARNRAAIGGGGGAPTPPGGAPPQGAPAFNPAMLGILQQVLAMQQQQQQRPPIQAPQPPGPQQVQFQLPQLPTTQQSPQGNWSRILGGM